MKEVRYTYRPKVTAFLFRTILFSVCALGLGYTAQNNDSGLLLKPLFDLSVTEMNILYWCLALAAAIFVMFSLLGLIEAISKGLIRDLVVKNEIVLTPTTLSLTDKNQFYEKITLKYSEIFDINIQEINGQCFFNIYYNDSNIYYNDNKLTIMQRMLPDKKSFDQLVNSISKKITTMPIKHYKDGSDYELHFTT